MKNKNDILKKTTLSTLSGAILVSSVPVHVFADVLNIENIKAEQEAPTQKILEEQESGGEHEDVKGEDALNEVEIEHEESPQNTNSDNVIAGQMELEEMQETRDIGEAQGIVNVPDANLEAVLRSALNKPTGDITQTDMESLTALGAQSKGISDLTGLEYAVNLERLDLHYNDVKDLTPIANLSKLRVLNLAENYFSDTTALANLTSLTTLRLQNNNITDVSFVSNLKNLTWLNFRDNRVSDLTPLSELESLEVLYAHGNQIEDISPLRKLTKLKQLYIYNNQIRNIDALSNMRNMEILEINNNRIEDLSSLQDLVSLKTLNLDNNQILDVTSLGNLINLTNLKLANNSISDISSLSKLVNLKELRVYANNLTDINVVSNFKELTWLNFRSNHVENIDAVANLTNLTTLYAHTNEIESIEALKGLTQLENVYLYNNRISDFSPLKDLTNVSDINISNQTPSLTVVLKDNQIENPFVNIDGSFMDIPAPPTGVFSSNDKSIISFESGNIGDVYNLKAIGKNVTINATITVADSSIEIPDANLEAVIRETLNKPDGDITQLDMESLKELNGERRGIVDLTGLEYAVNLERIALNDNQISNIECLKEMKKLESLNLSRNKIVDLTPLSGLTSLVSLEMYTNFYSDVSPLASLTNLTRLDLGNARVNSIEPLRNLTNLTFLAVQSNPNIEVEVLSEFVNLTSLNISNSRVSDISSLSKLTKLSSLYLEGNQIENIDVLSNMDSLYYLNISNNKVSDLSPLEGKSGLEVLLASGNQIRDVSPLSHLTSLNRLELANNQIMDFSSLGQLSNLNVLVANNQKLTLTIPEGYTNLINPLKDVNGDVIPLQNPSEGTVLDNGKTLQFDSLVAGETIYAEITDPTYQGQVTINVVNNLPTTNINIEQVTVGAGDKELHIAVVDGFYDIEKIILPDGSEVLGNQATFTVTTSGDYTIKAYDIAGNEFIETVSVTVTSPIEIINQAPVLEAKDIVITQGDKFNPLDYVTATDAEDNDSTLKVEVIKNTVNISQCGVYEVTYKVTDSQGASSIKTIQVTVNPKAINLNQAPVIEAKNLSIFVGYDIDLLSLVTATDAEDGDLTAHIVSSDIDNSQPGVYSATYEAVDSQGARATKTIYIVVRDLSEDNNPYTKDIVIAPNEELDIESIVNEIAKDKGLTDVEIIENNVDTSKPGDYGVVFEGTNTKKEQEIHSIKVTVMAETSSDKEDDHSSTSKPSGESVETGLTSGATITLGGLFTLAGIPFLKRKRK